MSYNLLKGKRGVIFGALNEQSIAWKVAERAVEEGAEVILTNTPVALRIGATQQLANQIGSIVVPADATSVEDLQNLVDRAVEYFGGKIDFVLHSVGMSPNVRKNIPYESIDYNNFLKTIDISALSFHKLLQVLYEKDAMAEYGSVVALSYIAAQRSVEGYSDMAEAKAMLESIARSFGAIYGRKNNVRVNTISQSPTLTTAGQGITGMVDMYAFTNEISPLGNASATECADYAITLFSDLTRKVTMQNLYHDGGYSSMGISASTIEAFKKGRE
jgi:enoyl-[acyl-carrier protein] reductase I